MKKIQINFKSFEQSSVIRKFTVLFLLSSSIPLFILFYLYTQLLDTGRIEITIESLQMALIWMAIGCAAAYWTIRQVIQKFIQTTKTNYHIIMDILGTEHVSPANNETNEIVLLAETFQKIKLQLEKDIHDLKNSQDQLKILANKDPLTNLFNYRYLNEALEYEIHRLSRYGGSMVLLVIDIDNFKTYTDSYGHIEGDHLLKEVVAVFNAQLRTVDIPCRYGGDEFILVLPQTEVSGGRIVAQRIKDAVSKLQLNSPVSISIGGAQWSKGMDVLGMIRAADQALYQAKQQGKNEVVIS